MSHSDATIEPSIGPFLTERLAELQARLGEAGPRVLGKGDAEALHDLRVALRRTRTVLELGRKVLGGFHADEVRRAFRDVQRATGSLRNEEILLDLVTSLDVAGPDVRAWTEARRRRESRLRGELRRMIRSGELERARDLLGALLSFRVEPARDVRIAKFARRATERAQRRVERERLAAAGDSHSLHELRIAYKKLRYTVETLVDTLPGDLGSLERGAARMQGALGDLLDVDVVMDAVRKARTLSPGGRGALLAALAYERAARAASCQRNLGAVVIAPAPLAHAAGGVAERKTSTR